MQELSFKSYPFRLKEVDSTFFIFDEIRKKFVVLQPEEWVRQHVVRYLIEEKKYPRSLINVEKSLTIHELTKRCDVIVFSKTGNVFLIVECKTPDVPITQSVFDQIARYNLSLKAELLMVTNGLNHYFCRLDYSQEKYVFLKDLPEYNFEQK